MPRRDLSRSEPSWAEADASSQTPAAAHAGLAIRGDRIPPLDGVRGLAILMVMLTHYDAFLDRHNFPQHILLSVFDYGWAGVDLFFVLSGFLITGILLRSREASNYFRAFYARRILRIFPLYYFSLLVLFGVLLPALHSHGQILPTFHQKLRYLLYVQNWFIALQWSGQYWSLAVEEQFYLVWPLIVYLFGRKRTLQIAIGASVFSLVLRFVLFAAGVNPILILTNVFTRLDSLMMGAACACLVQEGGFVDRFRRRFQLAWLAPLVVFPIVRLAAGSFHDTAPVIVTAGYTAIDVACACVLMAVVLTVGSRTSLQRFFTSSALRTLGKYSYAAYIWHVFVRVIVLWLEENALRVSVPWYVNIPLMIGVTLGVSALTYVAIERPFLSLKRYFEPVVRTAVARTS